MEKLTRHLCTSKCTSTDEIVDRVIGLVKKFDRIDACKVISRGPAYHLIFELLNFIQDFCGFPPNYRILLNTIQYIS